MHPNWNWNWKMRRGKREKRDDLMMEKDLMSSFSSHLSPSMMLKCDLFGHRHTQLSIPDSCKSGECEKMLVCLRVFS